jgi:hypothetical protein
MIPQRNESPSAFQNNVQKYKEKQKKTKGLKEARNKGTKEVKERKKGRRVSSSTTTRIILRTRCSILIKKHNK